MPTINDLSETPELAPDDVVAVFKQAGSGTRKARIQTIVDLAVEQIDLTLLPRVELSPDALDVTPQWSAIPSLNTFPATLGGGAGGALNAVGKAVADRFAALAATGGATRIGTTAPGAGAVARAVQDKLRENVSTADYATFAQAMAAAGGRLVVNSAVTIDANTTVPSTLALEVVLGGVFSVNAGATLTIAGPLEAGEFTIFGGAGAVVFDVTSRAKDLPVWRGGNRTAVFSTSRTLYQSPTKVGGPVHAFEDNGTLAFTNPKADNFNAYAAFDANTTATGPGEYDHMVAFQARQNYTGSGSIWVRQDGFNFLATHTGTGTIAKMRGVHIENPLGTGPIGFLAGVLVQRLSRGTENYGFYSATPMNVVSTGAGDPASWLLRGNGQSGGFGLLLQSAADNSGFVLNTANKELKFGTNNAENMRLTASGLLKIGATATVLTDNSLVEVQGPGGITLKATGGAGNACSLNWNNAATGDNLFSGFYTETAASQRGSIDFNRAGGLTRYNTTSDGTLKNIIGDASVEKSLKILAATRLRNYSWKDDPSGKAQIGPIAQELYEPFPGGVSVGGWYDETIPAVTEERLVKPHFGNQPSEYETVVIEPERVERRYRPWGVDKTAHVWHLVAGHQHHTKEISELRALVLDLTARLDAMQR